MDACSNRKPMKVFHDRSYMVRSYSWNQACSTESEHVAACPFLTWVSHSINCYNNSIQSTRRDKGIDHRLKVILAQTLFQFASESNLSISRMTLRLQSRSDGCTLRLESPIKKSLRIGFLTKRELNWMTFVLLGLHTNLLMVFHSMISLIHFWRVLRAGRWSWGSIVM